MVPHLAFIRPWKLEMALGALYGPPWTLIRPLKRPWPAPNSLYDEFRHKAPIRPYSFQMRMTEGLLARLFSS